MIYLSDEELLELPKRLSGQQSFFLRKLKEHPHGLPLKYWPRATTWRRWMRKPRFVTAMAALQASMESQTALLMGGAAHQSAMLIQATLTGGNIPRSGAGMNPGEIGLYDKSLRHLIAIMWLQMAWSNRRQRDTAQQLSTQASAAEESEESEKEEETPSPRPALALAEPTGDKTPDSAG